MTTPLHMYSGLYWPSPQERYRGLYEQSRDSRPYSDTGGHTIVKGYRIHFVGDSVALDIATSPSSWDLKPC